MFIILIKIKKEDTVKCVFPVFSMKIANYFQVRIIIYS